MNLQPENVHLSYKDHVTNCKMETVFIEKNCVHLILHCCIKDIIFAYFSFH